MLDKIFKIGILIIILILLYIYHESTDNHRFVLNEHNGHIFDTRTGRIYMIEKELSKKWIFLDPVHDAVTLDNALGIQNNSGGK